jgi:hypothetical protein
MIIKIAEEYTSAPGPRTREQGEYSGQQFREEMLKPAYEEAKANNEKLTVDLDGSYGYVTAFLEEAFGGLQKDYPDDNILETIIIVSEEQPGRKDRINIYIKEAAKEAKKTCRK